MTKVTGSTTLKERTTQDSRNAPSTTNLEEEEIVDATGNDGNASMPEQVKRPNPRRKMMIYGKGNESHQLETGLFVYHRTAPAVTDGTVCY